MNEEAEYGLIQSFYIDTDAYSDRDRQMFVCGAEFWQIIAMLDDGWTGSKPIHRENESRVRMLCGRRGIRCDIRPCDGYEEWSEFTVNK